MRARWRGDDYGMTLADRLAWVRVRVRVRVRAKLVTYDIVPAQHRHCPG